MQLPEFLAYIDPGTGSLVAQAVAASALGIAFMFKRYVLAPFRWVGGLFKKSEDAPTSVPESTSGSASPNAAANEEQQEEVLQ